MLKPRNLKKRPDDQPDIVLKTQSPSPNPQLKQPVVEPKKTLHDQPEIVIEPKSPSPNPQLSQGQPTQPEDKQHASNQGASGLSSPPVEKNEPAQSTFTFNFSDPACLRTIYEDDKLRNQLRLSLQTKSFKDQFLNDFKTYLDSFYLTPNEIIMRNYLLRNNLTKGLEEFKQNIMDAYLKLIEQDPMAKVLRHIPLKLMSTPELTDYLDQLLKHQVIWAWGQDRIERYIIITPPPTEELFLEITHDGGHTLLVDSKIQRRTTEKGKLVS